MAKRKISKKVNVPVQLHKFADKLAGTYSDDDLLKVSEELSLISSAMIRIYRSRMRHVRRVITKVKKSKK